MKFYANDCLVEPGEVEVHSDAQHDLSADDPTAADRQSESPAECDQAATDNEPSSVADAEHEPSVEPFGAEHDAGSIDEQQSAAARPADAVRAAHVRSHAAESDERKFEVGG